MWTVVAKKNSYCNFNDEVKAGFTAQTLNKFLALSHTWNKLETSKYASMSKSKSGKAEVGQKMEDIL